MKRLFTLLIISGLFFTSSYLFAEGSGRNAGFNIGVGSGYTFYGDRKTKDRISVIDKTNQIILYTDASFKLPLADIVYINFGADNIFDARWKGGRHLYILDYSFLTGFSVYPGLQGLYFSIDYALGCRTSFYDAGTDDDDVYSSQWGNGFKFGLGYDFSANSTGFSPVIGSFWRHMPRGGSSDNTIGVFIRFECK